MRPIIVVIRVHPDIDKNAAGVAREKIRQEAATLFKGLKQTLLTICYRAADTDIRMRLEILSASECVVSLGTSLFSVECTMEYLDDRSASRARMETDLRGVAWRYLNNLGIADTFISIDVNIMFYR